MNELKQIMGTNAQEAKRNKRTYKIIIVLLLLTLGVQTALFYKYISTLDERKEDAIIQHGVYNYASRK